MSGSPPASPPSVWPAGEYEGPLIEKMRHGNGIMRFRNGNKYYGEFVDDRFDGQGEYIWADGRTYVGQFKADKIQGSGVAHWPDGKIYDGEWVCDLADGHGILTLGDSRVFEGDFKNDFPVLGQMIEADGTTFFANFDGSTHASEWHPYRKCRIGKFQGTWCGSDPDGKYWIKEFTWDDGRRFAGLCVGYRPSTGVLLECNGDLLFVRYDGSKTFAENPEAISKRKLDWQVRTFRKHWWDSILLEPAALLDRNSAWLERTYLRVASELLPSHCRSPPSRCR